MNMTFDQARQLRDIRPEACGAVISKMGQIRSASALVRAVDVKGHATGRYIGLDRGTYEPLAAT